MKYITVFADASFCHETKAAGIAYWFRTDHGIVRAAKGLTLPVQRSDQAETIALCTGILAALNGMPHEPGDCVIAQSDCRRALGALMGNTSGLSPDELAWVNEVLESVADAGLTLRFKHVKAHTGASDPRSAVNQWCDLNAKRHMRTGRKASRKRVTSVP